MTFQNQLFINITRVYKCSDINCRYNVIFNLEKECVNVTVYIQTCKQISRYIFESTCSFIVRRLHRVFRPIYRETFSKERDWRKAKPDWFTSMTTSLRISFDRVPSTFENLSRFVRERIKRPFSDTWPNQLCNALNPRIKVSRVFIRSPSYR